MTSNPNPEEYRMLLSELTEVIEDGHVDDGLDVLARVIKERRAVLAQRLLRELNPGDVVRFNEKARPTYIQGLHATVVKRNQKRLVIQLTESAGRYRAGEEITTPMGIVERVEVES